MTRPQRGTIPSFRCPSNINTTNPPDAAHNTLLSRGLLSPTKKPPQSRLPVSKKEKKKQHRAQRTHTPPPVMASSSSSTPLL
jgi:hypothetical protein